ncbi:MAG: LysE family translocator [Hyphomicrobiaceae bacterium]|nr:LysE family translocator [Hyphomicrobiaceae bacterium]
MLFATAINFLLVTGTALFTPGPNNLMLLTSAAKFGPRATIPHGMGVVSGFCLMTFLLGLGVAEVMTAFPALKWILKYAAIAYFAYMAYKLLGVSFEGKANGTRSRPMRYYEAVLFQWINPKAWVIGISFVVAFVQPGENRLWSLLAIIGGLLVVSSASTVTWILFGERLRAFLRATGFEHRLGIILAGLMGIAIVLFLFS